MYNNIKWKRNKQAGNKARYIDIGEYRYWAYGNSFGKYDCPQINLFDSSLTKIKNKLIKDILSAAIKEPKEDV